MSVESELNIGGIRPDQVKRQFGVDESSSGYTPRRSSYISDVVGNSLANLKKETPVEEQMSQRVFNRDF